MNIRIPINLATEPFRRDRPTIVVTVALSALLIFVLVLQGYTIWSERDQAAHDKARDVGRRLQRKLKVSGHSSHSCEYERTVRFGRPEACSTTGSRKTAVRIRDA